MELKSIRISDKKGCDNCKDLVEQLKEENNNLRNRLRLVQDIEAPKVYNEGPFLLACLRLPALMTTLALELIGGVIIDRLNDVIKVYTLLVSFMPAISALSGNLGLQVGANTIRGIALGQIKEGNFSSHIWKEMQSGFYSSSFIALVICGVGTAWCYYDLDSAYINETHSFHPFLFGGILFMGTFISMTVSTLNGAGTPILAHKLKLDPAKIAGPLETAFQDLVGQTFLLGISYLIFANVEDFITM